MDATHIGRAGAAIRPDRLHAAGVSLFALAAQFMLVIMLGASIAPGYDMATGAISDLGVIEETALLFDLSLIVVGVLNALGGVLLFRWHERAWLFAVFLLASVGAIGAGVFPLDSGGPHGLFALVAFLAFNLEAVGVATVTTGPIRWLAVLAGILGLLFVALMAIGDGGDATVFGPIGHGGTERMIVYPVMLWMLGFGGWLMAAPNPADRPAGEMPSTSTLAG